MKDAWPMELTCTKYLWLQRNLASMYPNTNIWCSAATPRAATAVCGARSTRRTCDP